MPPPGTSSSELSSLAVAFRVALRVDGVVRDGPARLEPEVLLLEDDVRLRFFWKNASGILATRCNAKLVVLCFAMPTTMPVESRE